MGGDVRRTTKKKLSTANMQLYPAIWYLSNVSKLKQEIKGFLIAGRDQCLPMRNYQCNAVKFNSSKLLEEVPEVNWPTNICVGQTGSNQLFTTIYSVDTLVDMSPIQIPSQRGIGWNIVTRIVQKEDICNPLEFQRSER